MAQTPQHKDPVYDDDHEFPLTNEEHPASAPAIEELKRKEGISRGTSTAGGLWHGGSTSSTSAGDGGPSNSTSAGGGVATNDTGSEGGGSTSSTQDSTPSSTSELADREVSPSLYNSSPTGGIKPRNIKTFFWGSKSRRRKTVGGGLVGLLVGGGFFGLTILSGPGQLIQLSTILQRNFAPMQHASSNRFIKLFVNAGAQDVGETRVGLLGRQYLRAALSNLQDAGIEYQTNATGGFKSTTIDTGKLANNYPELSKMSVEEQQSWLADKLDLSPDQLTKISGINGNKFAINTRDFSIKEASLLKDNTLNLLGDGKIITAANERVLGSYFNLPSLFHPIKRAIASKTQQLTTAAERTAAEQDRVATEISDPIETNTAGLRASLKSKLSGDFGGNLTKVIIGTAALCAVRSAADDAIQYNHDAIVVPAALEATDLVAVGEQVKAGQDVTAGQVGGVVDGFTNSSGQTIWQGKALQALEGNTPSGPDLQTSYSQAFSSKTTANNIRNGIKLQILGVDVAGVACSKIGLVVQGLAGLALFIANIPDGEEVSYAAYVGEQAATTAAVGGATYLFEHQFTNLIKDTAIVPSVLSGPLGGNLAAYGARAAANIGAVASGGVALAGSATSQIGAEQQSQDQQQFRSEGFFARMFNIGDYRSLAGRLADSVSPSVTQNAKSAVNGFGNMGRSLLSSLSSLFLPKTQAATTYAWGFPQYGIPDSVLNDPAMANPYDNANQVATLLQGSAGPGLISKALTCFGVNITNSSGAWDVIPQADVNTSSDTYINANCSDTSDSNWERVMLFVLDTRTMQSAACYQGDDTSCSDLGFSNSTNTPTSTPTTTTPVSGNAQQLAQQILNNKSIDLSYNSSVLQDIQDAANGKVGTAGVMTSSAILKLIATVGQSHSVKITAIQSNGQGHCNNKPKLACPTDPHYNGDAVDFGALDGTIITGRNAPALTIINIAEQILPSGSGFGQSECGPALSLPSGFTDFPDTCDHLHVQVPAGTP